MNENLYTIILESKHGNQISMLHLIEKFRPLINKYARKLNYDGADSDLIISFICIIKAIPIKTNPNLKETKQIVGYISNSIRYKYIELSKNHSNSISSLEINEEIIGIESMKNIDDSLYLKKCLAMLPHLQKHIIEEVFFKDMSIVSVAEDLNISRQAVNNTKLRALKNLTMMELILI